MIGESGLAGEDFADGIEQLLESIRDRLFDRWLMWTENNVPDLRPGAKRRLNCERRRAFYVSQGFDQELLTFLSKAWSIPLNLKAVWGYLRRVSI